MPIPPAASGALQQQPPAQFRAKEEAKAEAPKAMEVDVEAVEVSEAADEVVVTPVSPEEEVAKEDKSCSSPPSNPPPAIPTVSVGGRD